MAISYTKSANYCVNRINCKNKNKKGDILFLVINKGWLTFAQFLTLMLLNYGTVPE